MLDQVVQWTQNLDAIVESLLLCRVLTLKLHRVYTFITLFCTVNVLFDLAGWVLGWQSRANERLYIYSLFLLAVVIPFAAWDVFEEIKTRIAKLRRVHAARLVSGIFMSSIFALILSAFLDAKDENGESSVRAVIAILIWAGSCSASLAFVRFIFKAVRTDKIELPNNTFVWAVFCMLTFVLSIVGCALALLGFLFNKAVRDGVELGLIGIELALTTWCMIRLRAVPSEASSVADETRS